MRHWVALIVSIFALTSSASLAEEHQGATRRCAAPFVVVNATNLAEADNACTAVSAAHEHLTRFGLRNDVVLRIEVVEILPVGQGHCVAMYDTTDHQVHVLSPHCLVGNPGRLGPFPDLPADTLFDSLIVHELTHAYVQVSMDGRPLPRMAHEYLAYALQLDALDEEDRARILEEASVETPLDTGPFSEALINFAPLSFAAMAWLHFQANGGDASVLERVMAGTIPFYSLRE